MIGRIFVDSNIWIYLFGNDSKAKQKIVADFIAEHSRTGQLIISYQVLNEVSRFLTKSDIPEIEVRNIIIHMMNICAIQPFSRDGLLIASELRETASFSFWDSHIVVSALAAQCSFLVSEDMQDGRVIEQTTIINIFKETI
jgi:predicted nucleic acid-binding protein